MVPEALWEDISAQLLMVLFGLERNLLMKKNKKTTKTKTKKNNNKQTIDKIMNDIQIQC